MVGQAGAYVDTLNRAMRDLLSQSGYDPDANTFPGLFGPVANVKAFGALGDGTTDDSVAIQAAIDSALTTRVVQDFGVAAVAGPSSPVLVFIPAGTYIVKNLLLRSNVHIVGAGAGATTLKLKSHTQDVFATGPGNVFGTTLNHDGNYTDPVFGTQTWYQSDGGLPLTPSNRAGQNGTQTVFIVRDVTIRGLTIDGNRANNSLGDSGANASVMGNCVTLYQAKNCWVIDCSLINARMDGLSTGYSLHGGTYFSGAIGCHFEGCGRLGVSFMTGHKNSLVNCTFKGNLSGGDIDIEGNLQHEVNNKHSIVGCVGDNTISIVAAQNSFSDMCRIIGCSFSRLSLMQNVASGSVVQGCTFDGGGTGIAIAGAADANDLGASLPIKISDSTFANFAQILDGWNAGASGQVSGLHFDNVTFANIVPPTATSLVKLYRPFQVRFARCNFIGCGNADGTTILFDASFNIFSACPSQGTITIENNEVGGANTLARFFKTTDGFEPPTRTRVKIGNNNITQPVTQKYEVSGAWDATTLLVDELNDFRRISANRADSSVTLNAGEDSPRQVFSTTLTANRTITLGRGFNGSRFHIIRTGLGAFTLDVGGLKTLPSATAAWATVEHNGTAWTLTAYGTL
jgi:hypothetical protein